MRNTAFIIIFCLPVLLKCQKSKFQIQVGTISNVTWVKGENRLLDTKFSKEWQKPNIYAGLSYELGKFCFIGANTNLQVASTKYTIFSFNIRGEATPINYRSNTLSIPLSIEFGIKNFMGTNNTVSLGGFANYITENKLRILNREDFSIPVFTPYYGEIKLENWNYGLIFKILQPLRIWELSSLDLGVHYNLGIRNVNLAKENPIKTHLIGMTLVWNVNLKRRVK